MTYDKWLKTLTKEDREDFMILYKGYSNPLYKAYCDLECE